MNKYLSNRIKRYQGIQVEVMEGTRNLCRRLGKNQLTLPTQATGKSQPTREQRKVSEHAGTRLNVSIASLLMIADDLVGGV
jgi:pSer/pThr/pTyr-binding forkhead associated (FHA) protein